MKTFTVGENADYVQFNRLSNQRLKELPLRLNPELLSQFTPSQPLLALESKFCHATREIMAVLNP